MKKTDAEWREQLSPAAYDVLIKRGTERSGTSSLNYEKRQGTFCCAGCRAPLFEQRTKFESGTGWPSFWDTIPGQVDQTLQLLYCLGDFGAREVRCHRRVRRRIAAKRAGPAGGDPRGSGCRPYSRAARSSPRVASAGVAGIWGTCSPTGPLPLGSGTASTGEPLRSARRCFRETVGCSAGFPRPACGLSSPSCKWAASGVVGKELRGGALR